MYYIGSRLCIKDIKLRTRTGLSIRSGVFTGFPQKLRTKYYNVPWLSTTQLCLFTVPDFGMGCGIHAAYILPHPLSVQTGSLPEPHTDHTHGRLFCHGFPEDFFSNGFPHLPMNEGSPEVMQCSVHEWLRSPFAHWNRVVDFKCRPIVAGECVHYLTWLYYSLLVRTMMMSWMYPQRW